MGEIYRVEDLKLGQTVALKFLPERLARNGAALARFHREVRLARQVSHPNVCRVFDLGEARGRPFLSMEFIEGEDLHSLLRQVGRLPPDKASEISLQLCAGLAAIHDMGVLHRDLKPSNVMVDARGRARIADFGVAALAGELGPGEARAGTLAYMAPEQIAAGEVSVRSDLYSLGLVLYEMFTGRRAAESPALAPSRLLKDMPPEIERVILRCLAQDPRDRPPSAMAVARSFPEGDLLGAALAAGETPSPEMVIAAPTLGILRPAVALSCLVGVLLAILTLFFVSDRVMAHRRMPLPFPPEVLADRARALLEEAGVRVSPAHASYGFRVHDEYLRFLVAGGKTGRRPPLFLFWYRQGGTQEEGIDRADVILDPEGRLWRLEASPDRAATAAGPLKWELLLRAAGFEPGLLKSSEPRRIPARYADSLFAWEATRTRPPAPIRVEASSYRGIPVSFEVLGPWSGSSPSAIEPGMDGTANAPLPLAAKLLLILAMVVLAQANLRRGRGDLNGAWRLTFFTLSIGLIGKLLGAREPPSTLIGHSAMVWCAYMAVEPTIRRHWPWRIVSWTRLLSGHLRDPMVGRDVLIGSLLGLSIALVFVLELILAEWMGDRPRFRFISLDSLLGFSGVVRQISYDWQESAGATFGFLSLFLILYLFFRRREPWAVGAFGIFILVLSTAASPSSRIWMALLFGVVKVVLVLILWTRFGVLTDLTAKLVFLLALRYPLTSDLSTWYSGATVFVIVAVLGLAVYGFATATAGRPWLRERFMDG